MKLPLPRHPQVIRYAPRTPIGAVILHGHLRNSPGADLGRRLAHFCFVYTLTGKTFYEDTRTGRHALKPGDLLLVHPNVAHRYGNGPKGGWDEYFIVFDGPVFDLWKNWLFDSAKPIINLQPVSYWHQRLAACVTGPEEPGVALKIRQVVNLLGFMTEVFEAQIARDPKHASTWLNQACLRLGSDLAEEIDWNAFARSLGMSSERFRKLFTKSMGIPPARYRTARIIDRACGMIRDKKLGKEIASDLGFANEQHFSRRFRQVTGMTLTQFRNQASRSSK